MVAKEVRDGIVEVQKIYGADNPAVLMTKFLSIREILERLDGLHIDGHN